FELLPSQDRSCCIQKTLECLENYPGQASQRAHYCQQDATTNCPDTYYFGCCPGYATCMSINAGNNVRSAFDKCINRLCFDPGH
uniref:Conotoxin p21a n=1 Tax=Conus purpurascens TaxID=41690 RepID=CX21A_CONPU|nr:RecName: Full=Conotoxin p21a [Conus purpurascens]